MLQVAIVLYSIVTHTSRFYSKHFKNFCWPVILPKSWAIPTFLCRDLGNCNQTFACPMNWQALQIVEFWSLAKDFVCSQQRKRQM